MILLIISCLLIVFFICGSASFSKIKKEAEARLASYQAKAQSLMTSYGKISYLDEGVCPTEGFRRETGLLRETAIPRQEEDPATILSIHGICGGYDQAYDIVSPYVDKYRIIAPSRFGYPGSDLPENATIEMQVQALVELLDQLKLQKVYMLATSAGGTCAIKFALMHPERLKGLILYSSGVPHYPATENPEKKSSYAGPPPFFCNDFAMWLISPLFKQLMGMDSKAALKLILPMKDKKAGIVFDSKISNTVMSNYPVEYNMEKILLPILIINAKDDKLASFEKAQAWSSKLKDCSFLPLEGGGHMMEGQEQLVKKTVCDFIERNKN